MGRDSGQKEFSFAGSDGGGESAAAIYSLLGTAKLNGIDPERYLRNVLSRIADHPTKRVQSGKLVGAERDLNALRDQAKRDGYAAFEFEARLLLAKAEVQSGKLAAARAHVNKLQSDTRSKGFLLITRQASVSFPTVN